MSGLFPSVEGTSWVRQVFGWEGLPRVVELSFGYALLCFLCMIFLHFVGFCGSYGPVWPSSWCFSHTGDVTVRPRCCLNSYLGSVADRYGLLLSSRLKRLSRVVTGSVMCKRSREVTGSITCCIM
jgi:hypothetical protein